MMKLLLTGTAAALFLALASQTTAAPRQRGVISVKIDGYVGVKPANVPVEVSWIVSVKGDMYDLHVSKLQVLTGKLAYFDIIAALRPYRPALAILGDDEQIDRFATAPAQQKISLTGFLQLAGPGRYLMINNVEYPGETEQTPTPQPKKPALNAFP